MNIIEIELAVLIILVVMLGSGVIGILIQIRDGLRLDFQTQLARAVLHSEIVVEADKKEKAKPDCECGHSAHQGECMVRNCYCQAYRPKNGPWPSDPPRI